MKASIGRIVHYVLPSGGHGGQHRPAIVVDMAGDNPHLQVFLRADDSDPDTGRYPTPQLTCYRDHVLQDEEQKRGGTWHWPERDA